MTMISMAGLDLSFMHGAGNRTRRPRAPRATGHRASTGHRATGHRKGAKVISFKAEAEKRRKHKAATPPKRPTGSKRRA